MGPDDLLDVGLDPVEPVGLVGDLGEVPELLGDPVDLLIALLDAHVQHDPAVGFDESLADQLFINVAPESPLATCPSVPSAPWDPAAATRQATPLSAPAGRPALCLVPLDESLPPRHPVYRVSQPRIATTPEQVTPWAVEGLKILKKTTKEEIGKRLATYRNRTGDLKICSLPLCY
ncbi:hypothetical protein PAPYR_5775 [Paratrimastix pyriformis]|uniref:Uncharacterized protein n=1 Tax=Paratrimastix pyriformis TaxID=342808 RepID=A0ABQ8UJH2_9EUKA|nr:hypothetical protein PAPYR_5775 [Paratrimastix pyriformis]